MKKELKKIQVHDSYEAQEAYRMSGALAMTPRERILEMYRLNYSAYGSSYGQVSKISYLYTALPGESLHDFFKRVNND